MILKYFPISACSGLLKFDMKMFVNVARLDIGQLFTQSTRWEHPCTLDTFLVFSFFSENIVSLENENYSHYSVLFLFFIRYRLLSVCKMPISYLNHVMRKPVYGICEQQRHRSACASAQSDQHLFCLLPR